MWGDESYKTRSRTFRGQGTGFVISSDGYICTNYHVVKKSDKVLVAINGKKYRAKVIGFDPVRDIALLKIRGKVKFKPVYFGNSKKVRIGDFAIAIGNPYGLDKTYTFGIISATGRRSVDIEGNSHIQTDASINKGNSGGPLLNIDGEVIGVNRAIFSRSGGNIGLGFAIPINNVKKILITLKKHGRIFMSYMGISVKKLSRRRAQSMGIKHKKIWYVYGVYRYSPALKSGIQRGDLILSINNKKIKSYRDLIQNIRNIKAGKVLKVKIWREGYVKYIYPKLKSMPLGRYTPLLF
jgi:serine protease Do